MTCEIWTRVEIDIGHIPSFPRDVLQCNLYQWHGKVSVSCREDLSQLHDKSMWTLARLLGNWPHYYRVVRSKLMFYNVLTTSINIKRKNSKNICSSETISLRIFGSAPNSPNTRRHLRNLVSPTSCDTVIGECTVPARPSPFSSRQISWHAFTRYQGNAMERPFSISALGSVYDVAQTIHSAVNQSQLVARCPIWNSLPPRLIIDRGFPDPAK
jgi:hypothetical protein